MTKTITVELGAMGEFKKLFAQLERKSRRLKLLTPTFWEKSETRREVIRTVHKDGESSSYAVWVIDVDINIPVPVRKAGNWTCIAVVKKNEDGSRDAIATGYENIQASKAFIATNDLICAHCNAKRIRNTTLLFQNESGKLIQVGKECAKEYGFDAAEAIAAFEFMDEVCILAGGGEEEGEGWFGGSGGAKRARVFATDVVLTAVVVNMVQLSQPYEKSKRRDERTGDVEENPDATWRTVLRMLTSYSNTDEAPKPVVAKTVADMKEWFASLDKETLINNEYIASLHSMIEDESISERKLPLFASVYQAYATGIRNRQEQVVPTTQVPEGRVVVTGKVVSLKSYDGNYGTTTKMLVVLEDGNKVFCTAVGNAKVGEPITFKVTLTRKDDHFAFGKVPKEVTVKEKAAKATPAQKNTAPKQDLKPVVITTLQQGPKTTAEIAVMIGKPTAPTFSVLKAMERRNVIKADNGQWSIA